jgi:Holliday junction resolvasome RuvABC endonuclease subunit
MIKSLEIMRTKVEPNFESDNVDKVILSIDPASHSLAFAVIERKSSKDYLLGAGKIIFPKKIETIEKLIIVGKTLPEIVKLYNPTIAVVEKTVYLQNPQTTVLLAYFVGHILGTLAGLGIETSDITPMTWKPGIGYKNVTKKEQETWELDVRETKKKAAFERKERVKRIVQEKIPGIGEYDEDVVDAIGIGIWKLTHG